MSNAIPALKAMRPAGLRAALEPARRLSSLAAAAIASAILARAMRRARHELAALDDRTLADIGLDRAAVEALAAIGRQTASTPLAQLYWSMSTSH